MFCFLLPALLLLLLPLQQTMLAAGRGGEKKIHEKRWWDFARQVSTGLVFGGETRQEREENVSGLVSLEEASRLDAERVLKVGLCVEWLVERGLLWAGHRGFHHRIKPGVEWQRLSSAHSRFHNSSIKRKCYDPGVSWGRLQNKI